MLLGMGFYDKWIHWMMISVTLMNYSVLVNLAQVGPIQPKRGLRQGDSLSPYLFILIEERLSSLIRSATNKGDIHEIRIFRGAPEVSHLLFADDCFLFCRENLIDVNHSMEMLKGYEEASRKKLNLVKSEVFFCRNLSIQTQEDLSRIMGVRHMLGT